MSEVTEISGGTGPLEGVVVADFSRILAGPYCSMLLADLGATVIKVESAGGDDTRAWIPPSYEGKSTYYLSINRNKHSVVLDLRDENDLQTAYDILDRADVFLENFKPGSLAKFGLGPEHLASRWPNVVHVSVTGFGSASGALPGYDLLAQAISGFMHTTGQVDGDPSRAGVAIFDVITGLHATIAVLAGLLDKQKEGLGQHIELNLLSSALSALVNQSGAAAMTGVSPNRMGNDHPSLFPYGPFQCQDRPLVICLGNDRQFYRFAEVVGHPEWAENPDFISMDKRNRNREDLRALMEEALSSKTAEEWFGILREKGLPAAPILNVVEGLDFAETLGLDPRIAVGEGDKALPGVRNPLNFSRSELQYRLAPPELGEHTDAIQDWIANTEPKRTS
ncbi:MAG: CoA transferase [Corynebacterium camporealensis]|uniref:CaiB/BaiF CoA transferase family protein n=1 Tax=Corynebacterium camporealensis TaxID=161896 RepID=UPI002A91DE0A|nr:CoA transferase [Corynebacterium camporealensis]MDY5840824.1 CoA transferase [Corynebacterium camporealensis]